MTRLHTLLTSHKPDVKLGDNCTMLAIPSLWALFVVAGSSVPTVQPTSAASGRIQRSTPRPGAVDSGAVVYGESAASRTIYTVVSMVSLSLLTGVLGKVTRGVEGSL
jgi:hypothetical protein